MKTFKLFLFIQYRSFIVKVKLNKLPNILETLCYYIWVIFKLK